MDKLIIIVLIIIAILFSIYFYKSEHLESLQFIELTLKENEEEKSINLDNTPIDLNIFFNRYVYIIGEKLILPNETNKTNKSLVLESIGEKYIRVTIINDNIKLENIGLFLYDKNTFIYGDEIFKNDYITAFDKQQNKISMIFNKKYYFNNIIRLRINTTGITKVIVDTKQINFTNSKEEVNNKIKEIHLTNGIICPSSKCQLII
jgi:hypothetical protein